MTETAVAAFLQFATETEFNEVGKAFAEMVYFHASQHIVDKGMLQENAGLSLGDSALSHIKSAVSSSFPMLDPWLHFTSSA